MLPPTSTPDRLARARHEDAHEDSRADTQATARRNAVPATSMAAHPAVTLRRPGQHDLDAALTYIDRHLDEALPLRTLAQLARLSVSRFVAVFRLNVGMTPHRYVTVARVRLAQSLLRQGFSPSLAAHECGFYDQSHLSRALKSVCGMTPRQFQSVHVAAAMARAGPMPSAPSAAPGRSALSVSPLRLSTSCLSTS